MTATARSTGSSTANGTAQRPPRPVALPVLADGIPAELRALDQWVVWRYVEDVDEQTGEVAWDKPPRRADGKGLASSTNPATWAPFSLALSAYQCGGLDGIGIVLHREPGQECDTGLVGIDLDHCRDPETGVIEPWALAIVLALNSYTEISPSGSGLRIFLLGYLPPAGRKRGNYEHYQTGRYVTVTGQHLDGTPNTVEDRQAELEQVHAQIWPKAAAGSNGSGNGHHTALDLDDAEVLRVGMRMGNGAGERFHRLWLGEQGNYSSHSEADLALCNYLAFLVGPDKGRIADLFAQSGLYRTKWKREDYRERTIAKALDRRTEFYRPKRPTGKIDFPGNGTTNGPAAPSGGYHLTDTGNARRVADRHGEDLRFCHPWKQWLTWDGTRWKPDDTGEPARRVKEAQAELYRSTADTIRAMGDVGDDEARKKELARLTRLLRHLLSWEDARKIAASLDLLRSEPGIPILPAQLDADPFLLNCPNGTLDLRTSTLRQHRREDYLTKRCPVEYDLKASCPTWHRFLDRVIASPAVRDYLQRVIGYCLTGDVREQALFFFHGAGANGKSTFLTAIREAMGDYAIQAVSELLLAKANESHPTERADLFGRRFVCTIETDQGKAIAEALMKQLTGGDSIRARKMRQDFFEFKPTHKIILAANHKPAVRGTDHAVWRRIKLIPFTVTISDAEKDPTLPDKLRAEYPGILAWAVEGCRQWLAHGLGEPAEVRQATADYQGEQDSLGLFIAECCHVHRDARCKASVLLEEYAKWSGDRQMTPEKFGFAIKGRGFEAKRSDGARYYLGLMLHAKEDVWSAG